MQAKNSEPEWREFEKLVARIEADAGPRGMVVKSPDRLRCQLTGKMREVDVSIRTTVGTTSILMTIECRRRRHRQDVTWIEQLAAKRLAIGAAGTLAVSASGFSQEAAVVAKHHGIELRNLSELSIEDLNTFLRLDFVWFSHRRASIARVACREFRSLEWHMPKPNEFDFLLPPPTDLSAPIFANVETGHRWSVNDLWRQLQGVADPFAGVMKGDEPVVRTCCFPYPGNVTVETITGPRRLSDVLLSVALWLEVEQVNLTEAMRVEYGGGETSALQRVEFTSREPGMQEWRVSLQAPKSAAHRSQLRVRLEKPNTTSKG